jgi:hypothetical protein
MREEDARGFAVPGLAVRIGEIEYDAFDPVGGASSLPLPSASRASRMAILTCRL